MKPKILVVDDQPINVKLLRRKLEKEGMDVTTANDGMTCLELVDQQTPDLILLDVMMPEMDGIEVCRRLKEEEHSRTIPIIFITAKSSKEGKIEGLDAGAADYITKPIDLEETIARVTTQLRIQAIHRENFDLQERLAESRQSAAIGAITQGIAHNLNNLLGVVVGYIDLLKSTPDSPRLVRRSTMLMDQAIQRMVKIVKQMTMLTATESVHVGPIGLREIIAGSIDRFRSDFDFTNEIEVHGLSDNPVIQSNPEIFETILERLLANACESYAPDAEASKVEVIVMPAAVTRGGSDAVEIRVVDRGRGMDDEVREHAFEPFVTSKSAVGRGLGLTIARSRTRQLGGELRIEPRDGGGTCVIVRFPVDPAAENSSNGARP